jgi:hypothetical protein
MVTNKILDDAARSRYDARMNNNELRRIARELRTTNRRNKLQIQRKRARSAYTKASLERFEHPHRFPTPYKYG